MMSSPKHCPGCGRDLALAALDGLCPKCVGMLAFGPEAVSGAPGATPDLSRRSKLCHFGDYELLEEIARGGMGVVFKARQVSLNRIVAVKMLLSGQFARKDFVERFHAEARAAAKLQHPNIVGIHEVGEHEGQQYFSMDYVAGGNLGEVLSDGPLPSKRAATYLQIIARAIHYAHERGVLHRDLKPSNILLGPFDEPRVTDFGLAKQLQGDSDLTLTGQMIGTPRYMPPEQARGRRGDMTVASDIYSLGAILYHLVTGRPPFAADSTEAVIQQVLHHEPVPPRILNSGVPRDLETICLKCLSKEPRSRYGSAEALADDLQRWLDQEPILARPIGPVEKAWRWCRRKPALAATIAVLHLVTAAGLSGILWQWRRAELHADAASQQSLRARQHAASETAQRFRAEEALTQLELQRAEDLLEKEDTVMGVAYLARLVRQQPTNRLPAQRLLSALTQRAFPLQVGPPLKHDRKVSYAEFSPDGQRVVTASLDLTARIWNAHTGEPMSDPIRHRDAVRFAHFSPDGGRLVTCGDESSAHLWEVATIRALGQPMTHAKKIWTAQFSPDGRRVLTASDDGTARIWDAHSGDPLLKPLAHHGTVWSARFSPDGGQIVTASEDKTAQVWDARSGLPAAMPFHHRGGVRDAEFSRDLKWVVTRAHDHSTRVWDVKSGLPLGEPLLHPAQVNAAQFSPEGQRIITALSDGVTRLWNVRDWAPLTRPLRHRVWTTDARFSPESQRVLTASSDNTARLWDAHTGDALTTPMEHDGIVWSAQFSRDGLFAVTASADQMARIWDIRLGGARTQPMSHLAPVLAAEFSPGGEWVVTGSQDATAVLWNSRVGVEPVRVLEHKGWVVAVQFSPDGERVATASWDSTARIWDARTGQPLTEPLQHEDWVTHLQFSPDNQLLATASKDRTVRLWNARTGLPKGDPIRHPAAVRCLCFSPDGQRLLSADLQDDRAQIRDVGSGQLLAETPAREGFIVQAEFSPDGRCFITASEDGMARVWDGRTGQPLTEPLRHKGMVKCARFSRDGRRVVTASVDSTAQVWDTQTGHPTGEPLRHRAGVNMVEFSPDNVLVVTASDDGTARLWDVPTGRPVADPFLHPGKVVSAHFSTDGRRVLTASQAGEARIWDVPPPIPVPSLASGGEDARAVAEQNAGGGTLLADLAESVIGKRVNAEGALESVSPAGLARMRKRVADLPRDADFTRWLNWFFAHRSSRTISPYSPVTIPDYIWHRGVETNEGSWREVLMLAPTNGLAFAKMARHHSQQSQTPEPADAAQADWASGQAVKFAPWDSLAWHTRQSVLGSGGAWTQLLAEADAAIQLQPAKAYPWHARARALEGTKQFEGMLAASSRALELWQADKTMEWDSQVRRDILLQRSVALRCLGRLAEASANRVAGLDLPARDLKAGPQLIDLGLFYNGGGDQEFPGGTQRLAGTDFDFRAWIHLDVGRVRPEAKHFPERVNNIPIARECRRLYFLHTALYASHLVPGTTGLAEERLNVPFGVAVGHYLVHYSDGTHTEIPILHGRDVRDYVHIKEQTPDDAALVVAWTGSNAFTRQHSATTRLYKTTWENPRPGASISSLDFIHAKTTAVPILVAITAEP